MTDDVLMDAGEIAVRLGMAKSSIYSLCASGKIPAYKAGKLLRGRRFDLIEMSRRLAERPVVEGVAR